MPMPFDSILPTLALSISGTGAFLLFLLGISIVIFLHELGHFAVAKMVGIRCDQFAIGFGKAALAWRKGIGLRVGTTEPAYYKRLVDHLNGKLKVDPDFRARVKVVGPEPALIQSVEQLSKIDPALLEEASKQLGLGETEYRLNYIPLGGYVKMLGQEDMDPTATSTNPRAYNMKPIWARMCVISAGVIMNVVTAVPMFMIAFMVGVDFPPAIVGGVAADSPAAKTAAVNLPEAVGLRAGDRIVLVDGQAPVDFLDVKMPIMLARQGEPVEVHVERPTYGHGAPRELVFNITPEVGGEGFLSAGILPTRSLKLEEPQEPTQLATFERVVGKYGFTPGATITAVNGTPVDSYGQFNHLLQASGGKPLIIATDANAQGIETPVQTRFEVDRHSDAPTDFDEHLAGLIPATQIEAVVAKGPSDGALEVGDVVAAVEGVAWPTVREFRKQLRAASGKIDLTVLRGGERIGLTIEPGSDGKIGVYPAPVHDAVRIAGALDGSAFEGAQLAPGTIITAINGKPVATFADVRGALQAGGEMALSLVEPALGGTDRQATVTLSQAAVAGLAALPWNTPVKLAMVDLKVPVRTGNPVEALALGFHKTKVFLVQTYLTLGSLVAGTVPTDKLSGPVGIGKMGTKFADQGMAYLLYFLALISVNLAVINFLPLPIVDGGHFVLLIIEKLRGKPLPAPIINAITIAGMVLLGGVFLYVTYNDIFVNWSKM